MLCGVLPSSGEVARSGSAVFRPPSPIDMLLRRLVRWRKGAKRSTRDVSLIGFGVGIESFFFRDRHEWKGKASGRRIGRRLSEGGGMEFVNMVSIYTRPALPLGFSGAAGESVDINMSNGFRCWIISVFISFLGFTCHGRSTLGLTSNWKDTYKPGPATGVRGALSESLEWVSKWGDNTAPFAMFCFVLGRIGETEKNDSLCSELVCPVYGMVCFHHFKNTISLPHSTNQLVQWLIPI